MFVLEGACSTLFLKGGYLFRGGCSLKYTIQNDQRHDCRKATSP